jgi:20S proteasome alpha/beta subunit
MTVIAWDGKTLAADKLSTDGTSRRTVTKIHRLSNGAVLGACGDAGQCREMQAWYCNGAKPEELPPKQRDADTAAWLLVIEPGPRILYFQLGPYPILLEDKIFAMGSGREYAMAAMHLGKTAREACEVAIALSPECGQGVDELELEA